jgi:dienelactone hydrolase
VQTISQEQAVVAGVPALLTFLGPAELAKEHGTVLFYHGFGGAKERPAQYLTALAEAGFLAVSLDAVGHGERRFADFDTRFSDERWERDFAGTETEFLQLIDATAAEIPAIIDELLARDWATANRIGVAGRSLGGNVAYAAVLADRRVRAAVSVVGSPEWTLPWPESPHQFPDRFYPAAIQAQAAEFDEHSPATQIRDFHIKLESFYTGDPSRNQYVEYHGAGHFLTPELNADSCNRLVAWFDRWLSG